MGTAQAPCALRMLHISSLCPWAMGAGQAHGPRQRPEPAARRLIAAVGAHGAQAQRLQLDEAGGVLLVVQAAVVLERRDLLVVQAVR